MGADGEVLSLGTNIASFNLLTYLKFTAAEQGILLNVQTTVRRIKVLVNERIRQIHIMLKAYTNREIIRDSVDISNITFTVPMPSPGEMCENSS